MAASGFGQPEATLRNLTRRSEAFQALDGSIGVPHPAPSLPQLGWTGAVRNLNLTAIGTPCSESAT